MKGEVEHLAGPRLQQFLETVSISLEEASIKLNMRPAQLKRIFEGKLFRTHWVLRFQMAFPSLSVQWLITGKGEMLVHNPFEVTEEEKKAVALLDEARSVRDTMKNAPAKRKAELSHRVIDVAERLYEENQENRERLVVIRENFIN